MVSFKGERVTQTKCTPEKKWVRILHKSSQIFPIGYNDHISQAQNMYVWLDKDKQIWRIKGQVIWNQNCL